MTYILLIWPNNQFMFNFVENHLFFKLSGEGETCQFDQCVHVTLIIALQFSNKFARPSSQKLFGNMSCVLTTVGIFFR